MCETQVQLTVRGSTDPSNIGEKRYTLLTRVSQLTLGKKTKLWWKNDLYMHGQMSLQDTQKLGYTLLTSVSQLTLEEKTKFSEKATNICTANMNLQCIQKSEKKSQDNTYDQIVFIRQNVTWVWNCTSTQAWHTTGFNKCFIFLSFSYKLIY
jgi:hypothetical protein